MKFSSFFNTNLLSLTVGILSAIGVPHQVEAAVFSGEVSGIWKQPQPGINTQPVYSGVGTNAFSWGDPTRFPNAFANQLVFEGSSFSANMGSLFKIGDLTYRNGTVLLDTSVESVPLNLKLSFNKPPEVNQDFNYDYEFYLQNVPNLSDNPELNADFVFVNKNSAKPSFVYGGNTYTLSLTGFSQNNGKTNVSEFRVLEPEKTTAPIFARINKVSLSKTVPQPGFLIGLSALGIYLIAQKKVKKIN